jgi:hypothetical protein
MKYTAIYLPVDKPRTDGCTMINAAGYTAIYSEADKQDYLTFWKVAELFLVAYEYNERVIIGQPSPKARWIKPGTEVRAADCELWYYNKKTRLFVARRKEMGIETEEFCYYWRVKCENCGDLH